MAHRPYINQAPYADAVSGHFTESVVASPLTVFPDLCPTAKPH